jgi:hypothetical protein
MQGISPESGLRQKLQIKDSCQTSCNYTRVPIRAWAWKDAEKVTRFRKKKFSYLGRLCETEKRCSEQTRCKFEITWRIHLNSRKRGEMRRNLCLPDAGTRDCAHAAPGPVKHACKRCRMVEKSPGAIKIYFQSAWFTQSSHAFTWKNGYATVRFQDANICACSTY